MRQCRSGTANLHRPARFPSCSSTTRRLRMTVHIQCTSQDAHRVAPAQLAAAEPAAAPAAGAEQPRQPKAIVRRYCANRDHADVVEICRNVYDGTDDLPDKINGDAQQPGTHIFAASAGNSSSSSTNSSNSSSMSCAAAGSSKRNNISGTVSGSNSSSGVAPIDALLCCQHRGDVLWLYGARTREERRGNGLAHLLLEEAETLAGILPGVAALLSITVPANETMRRLFVRRGLQEQCRILSWPATPAVLAAHRELEERRAHQAQQAQQGRQAQQTQQVQRGQQAQQVQQARQQEVQQAHETLSLLSVLPAVAAVADSAEARRLLPNWRVCRSQAELAQVLMLLREQRTSALLHQHQQQQRQLELAGESSSLVVGSTAGAVGSRKDASRAVLEGQVTTEAQLGAASNAFLWVPAEYELVPAGSARVAELIQQGRMWVLGPADGAQESQPDAQEQQEQQEHQQEHQQEQQGQQRRQQAQQEQAQQEQAPLPLAAALFVSWGPGFRGVRNAGIVAGSRAALESALLHASAGADPLCCRFYVDCCARFDHEALWGSTPGERYDILPFYKPLK